MAQIILGFNYKFVMKVWTLLLVSFIQHSHCQTSSSDEVLHYSIYEEVQSNTKVGNIKADAKLNHLEHLDEFVYSFRYQTGNYLLFSIDEKEGIIRTKQVIDRESVCPHTDPCLIDLDITIRPVAYFQMVKVSIKVLDVNDHAPIFPQSKVIRSISEEIVPGITFPLPHAEDPDSGTNSVQIYRMQPLKGPPSNKFGLHVTDNADGTKDISLQVEQKLDREEESSYSFVITAYDGADPPKSGSMVVEIAITDSNDNNPVFASPTYEVQILENVPIHKTIATVHATDPDSGNNGRVVYNFTVHTNSLYGKLFGINENTGDIFVKGEINYELENVYHLTVTATDLGPNSRPAYCKVVITVIDLNDHPPKISINTLTDSGFAEVMENDNPGAFVSHVSVSDPDQGSSGNIKCSIDKKNRRLFELQQISNTFEFKIVTLTTFDRETEPTRKLTINCTDLGLSPLYAVKDIDVHILDKNDHGPQFSADRYFASVQENSDINSFVTKIIATDIDEGENAEITYSIQGLRSQDSNLVKVNPVSGVITTNTKFDFEKQKIYKYLITATDHGHPEKSAVALLNLTIIDINDEAPQFIKKMYSFNVTENKPAGTLVGHVSATDGDAHPYNQISYFIDASTKGHDNFEINNSGYIHTTKPIDREENNDLSIVVVAHNEDYANTVSKVPVKIRINDENDNVPSIHFPNPRNKSVSVSGQTPVGHVITIINATDPDAGNNSQLFYRILSGNSEGMFIIDNATGVIFVAKSLKDINQKSFTLVIRIKDSGDKVQLENVTKLGIVVDKNILFAPAAHSNLTNIDDIMLPLGIVVGIVILLMIIILAVLIVKYRYRRAAKGHKYNCRLEANKTLINGPQVRPHIEKTYQLECDKDNRSANTDDMMIRPDEDPKDSRHHTGMMIDFHQDHCPMKVQGGHHPFMETELDRQTKMPDIVNLSHTEVDSECSGADSGKGTSEEGDYTQSNHSSPNSDILDIHQDVGGGGHIRNHECENPYTQNDQLPPNYGTHNNVTKKLYNLDAGAVYGSDLELYNYHRTYSPLTTFSSKPHSIDVPQSKLDRSYSSTGRSGSYGSNNIDNVRCKLQNIKNISHRNPRDVSYRGYQRCAQSSQSNSPIEEELIAYPPPPVDINVQKTEGTNSFENTGGSINNKAFESSPDSWSGREGSIRGRQDGRRHLFGNQLQFDQEEFDSNSNNTLNPGSGQKSAFRSVGGNQRNTLKKKEVRFADKCEELSKAGWTEDEIVSSASVDGLSEDGASITSGCYILDDNLTAHTADTFV